jgi:beta-galactosidase
MTTRRNFLSKATTVGAALTTQTIFASELVQGSSSVVLSPMPTRHVVLDGNWHFRLDANESGEGEHWYQAQHESSGWTEVTVPHTWQIYPASYEYTGTAWYRRPFDVPAEWRTEAVSIEFEAVFHSATVWVNGVQVGQHLRKGYTAFQFDISTHLRFGGRNLLAVKVNNAFDERMLPRGKSSDWTNDGGIYRPVNLLITPKVYIERVDVDSIADLATNAGEIDIAVVVRNTGRSKFQGELAYDVVNELTGLSEAQQAPAEHVEIPAGTSVTTRLPKLRIPNATLWHFDAPRLYSLSIDLYGHGVNHRYKTKFGIRRIEVKSGSFYLNGERVRLMGVERMAGSNPEFGMAEPRSLIDHDHRDLKALNCIFTRVHWPQDKRVLDYCDRHGILIQTEVPSWGPDTFKGMTDEPAPEIMQNGLEQLQEMISRDRNHPSIFSWGLCNEIHGQNPPAYKFAQRMYEEAKKLDPGRLCSYASNSLQKTPHADVSTIMDFVEWNEYYESWYGGTPDDLRRHLQEIHEAFPDKPIVISEYGYCACTPERPEGDARRIEVLRAHTQVCRDTEYVGGLIFFCYNDYRTHIGDKGKGVIKQRIHGVVDLLGGRKPSYSVLREESSPVESLDWSGGPASFVINIRTRKSVPAYRLTDYKVRGILYGHGNIPLEQQEALLPSLTPGQNISTPFTFTEPNAIRVEFDVIRPTGFSALSKVWSA